MKILVACEESQAVCKAFRAKGHEAYSCDILPCSGGHPEWHIQGDVLEQLDKGWDIMIAHPPCTYLTVTGNRWFNVEKYGEKALQRARDREDAVKFFLALANAPIEKIAIENPVGTIATRYRKADQLIQPWMFGDAESKLTALWLKNLPLLAPTKIVDKGERVTFKSGKTMPKWYSDAIKLSPKERSIFRSKTFSGIAKAMADQWG